MITKDNITSIDIETLRNIKSCIEQGIEQGTSNFFKSRVWINRINKELIRRAKFDKTLDS